MPAAPPPAPPTAWRPSLRWDDKSVTSARRGAELQQGGGEAPAVAGAEVRQVDGGARVQTEAGLQLPEVALEGTEVPLLGGAVGTELRLGGVDAVGAGRLPGGSVHAAAGRVWGLDRNTFLELFSDREAASVAAAHGLRRTASCPVLGRAGACG